MSANRFVFLRIDRKGPGGLDCSECSLLDDSGLPGVRAVLSSWLVDLSAIQADRLEAFFVAQGVEVQRKAEVPERREYHAAASRGTAPAAARGGGVHASNSTAPAAVPSLFEDAAA